MRSDPDGAQVIEGLHAALRPPSPGYGDRVIAATALLSPDWPARTGRRLVMALAGKLVAEVPDDQRSLRLVHEQATPRPQ